MRRFGIEIEQTGLGQSDVVRIMAGAGVQVYDAGYSHSVSHRSWKAVSDSSLAGHGCEVVSPILEGDDGMSQVKKVCEALEAAGAGINRSCGFHVHIDARGLTGPQIQTIVTRYGRYEHVIDAFMPPSRRGSANSYASSMVGARPRSSQEARDVATSLSGRYRKVNLESYVKYGTIEFRHHSGTVNWAKVSNWIRFLQAFVEECVALSPRTEATTQAVVNDGLSRSAREVVRILTGAYMTPADVAALIPAINEGSVKAILSDLRRAGYNVQRIGRPGRYRYSVEQRATPMVVVASSRSDVDLWQGIPADVREFYRVRTSVLSGGGA